MSDTRQRAIIKVFRKYSNSLGPDAIQLVEQILDENGVSDHDIDTSVELLAKEYNKQDDALMKVSVEILKRVYESLQNQGEVTESTFQAHDIDNHIFFIDAFEMPLWHWSVERGTFERTSSPQTNSGSPDSRVLAMRDRLHIIKQCVSRNEHFAPSTIPSRVRDHLVTLKSTKQLLGRAGERFLLLGMLCRSKEGKMCVEDADGLVEIDLSRLDEPGDGIFTEGSFALVEGEYTEEAVLEIIAIGLPPCETRETARSIYGHIDFLGQGATTLLDDAKFAIHVKEELSDVHFFVLSDVWLDHPKTLQGLQKLFENCIETNFIPKLMILCGNFTSQPIVHGNNREVQQYQEGFDALADLLVTFPLITRNTHFVFVPGPADITSNAILPRRPLLSSFAARLKSKIPKIHFGTNPCRIKFFHQEIVIFRENLMAATLRNAIGIKPEAKGDDLKRFLVQTVLDQAHLSPFTINIQPSCSDFDHAMRLYPLPTVLILADRYDRYKMTYTGCHVFNPGSFVGDPFVFSAYKPAEQNSEECVLPWVVDEGNS